MVQPFRRAIIAAMALVVLTAPLAQAENHGKTTVGSIEFKGLIEFKPGAVKKVMDTRFPSWIPFVGHPGFDEEVLKSDMKNIEAYYQGNGYFEVTVSYKLVFKDKKKTSVKILIDTAEGPPSIVEKITIRTSGGEQGLLLKLNSLVELKRGERFRYELYEASKKKMRDYLNDNGYGSAFVSGKAMVNKDARAVEAVFSIDEGTFQRFGETAVTGNKDVKTKDIAAELDFKPGEIFSSTKLDRSRVNIFNLNLFRSVSVTPVISSGTAVVPVNVEIVEGNKRQIRFGVGYGAEAKFRTSAQWSRYYLWGRPRTLTIDVSYSSLEEKLAATVFQPYFLDRKNSLTLTGAFVREDAVSYTNEKITSQLQVKRNFTDKLSVFTAYNLEVNRPVNLEDILLSDILTATPGSSYFISSLSAGLNSAFVDNPSYPSHGFTYSLYFEPATYLLGSQVDYLKGVTECHLYGILVNELILASRLKFGFIRPYRSTTEIPIFKRFFSGGSYSVRGFGYQQIGPKDPAGNPLGGQYQFEGNLELRYPIKGNLKGVVFMDSGNIYQSSFSLNAYDLSYGVGTGIRYVTPIGPLGIDLAFPVEHLRPINLSSYYFYLTIGQGF